MFQTNPAEKFDLSSFSIEQLLDFQKVIQAQAKEKLEAQKASFAEVTAQKALAMDFDLVEFSLSLLNAEQKDRAFKMIAMQKKSALVNSKTHIFNVPKMKGTEAVKNRLGEQQFEKIYFENVPTNTGSRLEGLKKKLKTHKDGLAMAVKENEEKANEVLAKLFPKK